MELAAIVISPTAVAISFLWVSEWDRIQRKIADTVQSILNIKFNADTEIKD